MITELKAGEWITLAVLAVQALFVFFNLRIVNESGKFKLDISALRLEMESHKVTQANNASAMSLEVERFKVKVLEALIATERDMVNRMEASRHGLRNEFTVALAKYWDDTKDQIKEAGDSIERSVDGVRDDVRELRAEIRK